MCWSANGSLSTYIFAMFLAAIHKNIGIIDPSMWSLMVVYSHMQLVEYFLWKNLKTPDLNKFWSGVGLFLLLLQPVISSTMLPLALRSKFLLVYSAFLVTYFTLNKVNLSTTVGDNGHLKWNWICSLFSPWALAWLAFLVVPMLSRGYNILGLLLSYMISAYFNDRYGTAGSYWCWFVIVGWVLAFFYK